MYKKKETLVQKKTINYNYYLFISQTLNNCLVIF